MGKLLIRRYQVSLRALFLNANFIASLLKTAFWFHVDWLSIQIQMRIPIARPYPRSSFRGHLIAHFVEIAHSPIKGGMKCAIKSCESDPSRIGSR